MKFIPVLKPTPLLNVGLAPLAQMLVLPPLIFRMVAAWRNRASAAK